jgi:hypothetical protein
MPMSVSSKLVGRFHFLCYNMCERERDIMNKVIHYNCATKVFNAPDTYYTEELTTVIELDYTDAGVDTWNKGFMVRLSDGTSAKVDLATTDLIVTHLMDWTYMDSVGRAMIQPFATQVELEVTKIRFFGQFPMHVQPSLDFYAAATLGDTLVGV